MSQILRAMRIEITQIRRFCGSRRSTGNHYETLRIPENATQKDIRLAFIKLSKEMHPDTSGEKGHAEFVKISDAYRVLGKPSARQRYDANLKFEKGTPGRSYRTVHYESAHGRYGSEDWQRSREDRYAAYGARAGNGASKVTIAMLCLVFSAVGFAAQMLLVSKSLAFSRDRLTRKSKEHAAAYRKARDDAAGLTREEQIAAFDRRRIASKRASSERAVDLVDG